METRSTVKFCAIDRSSTFLGRRVFWLRVRRIRMKTTFVTKLAVAASLALDSASDVRGKSTAIPAVNSRIPQAIALEEGHQ